MGGQGCTEAQHISVRDRHAARTRSQQERLLSVQRSGTSSGPIVIGRVVSEGTILVSDPTWGNHRAVSGRAGLRVPDYRYLDDSVRFVGIEGTPAGSRGAGPGSVVLPDHAARNPSGYGTGRGQWRCIVEVSEECGLASFFDIAYQGFSWGVKEDGAVVRAFVKTSLTVLVSASFSKAFLLYGERIDEEDAARARSRLNVNVCIKITPVRPRCHRGGHYPLRSDSTFCLRART